jgi:hypothetical protein
MTNDTPPVAPVEGDYTIMPTKLAEALNALVPLADAVCDYADSQCRWFDISTAPKDGSSVMLFPHFFVSFWDDEINGFGRWNERDEEIVLIRQKLTHWAPLPPPPSNPPLPAVFVELGAALEGLKSQS